MLRMRGRQPADGISIDPMATDIILPPGGPPVPMPKPARRLSRPTLLALLCWLACATVIGLATGVAFSLAVPIARVLGKTGINVMTRLMGLILAALAVEVMADGLGKLFPILGRAAAG